MKHLSLLSALSFTLLLAACGGGSITPPPPAGGFSNASLVGQYAFSLSGEDSTGAYVARVGSFAADGKGSITAGIEDFVEGNSAPTQVTFTGGTYTIQPNGRGTLAITASTGNGLQLSLTLISASQGILVETDLIDASSGHFALQTPNDFSSNLLEGNFVVDLSGISFAGVAVTPLSVIGQITLNGTGNVTGGVLDENDGTPSGPTVPQTGSYQLDTNGNGSNFGRGTMSFDGRSFAFYIVDSSHFELIEEDALAATMGNALLQSGSIATQNSGFTGSFVYLVTGASVLGPKGDDVRVARFTADGNGGIAAISYDENSNGNAIHFSQGSNISKASYSIDAANAGSGRGTFTFTESSAGTYTYIFYLVSPTQAVVQDNSPGIVADGPMQQQSGSPFTNAGIAGNYAFNWTGTDLGTQNAIPSDEDYVGQYILVSAAKSNISGTMDFTELGLSAENLYTGIGIAGTLTIRTDGTSNNALTVADNASPSTTYNFAYYIVSADTGYMVCTDSTRVTAGIAIQQSQ